MPFHWKLYQQRQQVYFAEALNLKFFQHHLNVFLHFFIQFGTMYTYLCLFHLIYTFHHISADFFVHSLGPISRFFSKQFSSGNQLAFLLIHSHFMLSFFNYNQLFQESGLRYFITVLPFQFHFKISITSHTVLSAPVAILLQLVPTFSSLTALSYIHQHYFRFLFYFIINVFTFIMFFSITNLTKILLSRIMFKVVFHSRT